MKNKKGFTIIEVSLVLAIGGLILMMVFIALPTLQRNQRDAKRREDVLLLLENIKKYQQDNRGALPNGGDDWTELKNDYLGTNFKDPNGEEYKLSPITCSGEDCAVGENDVAGLNFPNEYTIIIAKSATCNGSYATPSSNPRRVAAIYKLEGPGVFCANT